MGVKHTKIEHCITTLHSPLLLPPHEVINMGPHAAGEGSDTQLNNSLHIHRQVHTNTMRWELTLQNPIGPISRDSKKTPTAFIREM